MDVKEQLKDIKTQLRLSMNGVVSQSMREKGLDYKLNFGVELPLSLIHISEPTRQVCGYLTIARLLMKKGDMAQRPAGELLDQAICAVQSGSYHVRNAAMLAIRKYMQHSEEHAFQVCRLVEGMENSEKEAEQMLYAMVKDEIND